MKSHKPREQWETLTLNVGDEWVQNGKLREIVGLRYSRVGRSEDSVRLCDGFVWIEYAEGGKLKQCDSATWLVYAKSATRTKEGMQ